MIKSGFSLQCGRIVAVALLASVVGTESEAQTPRQKEITIWSADVTYGEDGYGDEPGELPYPNATIAGGYYRWAPYLTAGDISDDDFAWKGTTYTIDRLATVSTGRVLQILNGNPIIEYASYQVEFSVVPGIKAHPEVEKLSLYADGRITVGQTVLPQGSWTVV